MPKNNECGFISFGIRVLCHLPPYFLNHSLIFFFFQRSESIGFTVIFIWVVNLLCRDYIVVIACDLQECITEALERFCVRNTITPFVLNICSSLAGRELIASFNNRGHSLNTVANPLDKVKLAKGIYEIFYILI